jgi:hypothetical protein
MPRSERAVTCCVHIVSMESYYPRCPSLAVPSLNAPARARAGSGKCRQAGECEPPQRLLPVGASFIIVAAGTRDAGQRKRAVLDTLTTCVAMLATLAPASAEPMAAQGARQHPGIAAIKAIYREIRQAEAAGRLSKQRRTFAYCRPYDDSDRTLYLDRDGAARSYHTWRGSEDSAAHTAYYYDRAGALRFVLVKAGAVNGTAVEFRLYLSRSGEHLWEERRDLKGPGWAFPHRLPDAWLVRGPSQAFNSGPPCPQER